MSRTRDKEIGSHKYLMAENFNLKAHSPFGFAFVLVREVDKGSLDPVEDEPSFAPLVELEAPMAAHLEQVAAARVRVEQKVLTRINLKLNLKTSC